MHGHRTNVTCWRWIEDSILIAIKKIVSPTVGEKQKQVNKQNPQRWAPDFIKYEESL